MSATVSLAHFWIRIWYYTVVYDLCILMNHNKESIKKAYQANFLF